MTLWTAQIIKPATADSEWVLLPGGHYTIGAEVVVDLESKSIREFTRDGEPILCEVVAIADEDAFAERVWIPCEILSL